MPQLDFKGLNKGERFVVEWQYGMLGGFMNELAELMCRAKPPNLELLGLGFPDEANAIMRYKNEVGFWEEIKKKAANDV